MSDDKPPIKVGQHWIQTSAHTPEVKWIFAVQGFTKMGDVKGQETAINPKYHEPRVRTDIYEPVILWSHFTLIEQE